jgi:ribonuclease Z
MRPLFHPKPVNDPFGDPALYVDCLFEKRALMFDLGDIRKLAPRKILRLSHIFVSHTHMDHFMGFDWLLRISLGREKVMHLFGPARFLEQVEHKLAAYTWNLVENYSSDFTLAVTEVQREGVARRARFRCRAGFRREAEEELALADGVLVDEAMFRVRCTILDHKTPCLGFALEEKAHVNVWKNRLAEMGLPMGPWLRELKQAILQGEPDDTPFRVWWKEDRQIRETLLPLKQLKARILRIVPGQKISYVTDLVYHPENARKVIELACGSDLLFIEAGFLQQDAERAAQKFHLTAWQAATLAREAGAKNVIPLHFSPCYSDREALLRQELEGSLGSQLNAQSVRD